MKILIIEDDSDLRSSLRQALEDENLIVDAVADGAEGFYRATEWKYDVVLLDAMLPEMDGWTLLEKLRKARNNTPILMLTALDDLENRVRGLDLGADDYLTKPYSERELLARIKALHRRAVGQASYVLHIGAVEIDTNDRSVARNGSEIELTAAQYRIVEYLALRAGKVISRQELSEAIIGEDEAAISNVLEVQVYHIRRKLGKDFIQNKRGLGYLVPKS